MADTDEREPRLIEQLAERGVTRRDFLKWSAAMAALLALPPGCVPEIAREVAAAPRLPIIWLEGQDCAGNTEAFLRSSKPTISQMLLDTLSLDYHETLMAPAGVTSDKSRQDTMARFPGRYVAVIEGSIPLANDGVYCTVGGRTFASIAREVCSGALATIAVGSCAVDGGLPAARGGVTGAVGVRAAVTTPKLISLPGCPANAENITATIVHYLTFKRWPETDDSGRPHFAYGTEIHEHCSRREHYDEERFVRAWGDAGHRKGWCLFGMGCRGPETDANCPTVRFNSGTGWPIGAGHPCIGCTTPAFWDRMTPFYVPGDDEGSDADAASHDARDSEIRSSVPGDD